MKEQFVKLCCSLFVLLLFLCLKHNTLVAFAESNIDLEAEEVIGDSLVANNSDFVQPSNSSEILSGSEVIENGVYAFQSFITSSRWMTVAEASPYENEYMQHEYQSTFPTDSFNRASLFKISRVEESGTYIIRSMINNRISFSVTDASVITKRIPSSDDDVSLADTFYIELSETGYLIRPYGSTKVITVLSLSTSNLTVTEKTSAGTGSKWSLVKYTGSHQSGMMLYRPPSWTSAGIVVGDVTSASLIGWSTYINANTLQMYLNSDNENLADAVWDVSTDTITITAVKPGRIQINSYLKQATTNTSVFYGYNVYYIVPQEGVYYIQNVGENKYIDIEGPSKTSGALVQAWLS